MKISTGPANVGNFQGNSPLEPEPPAISTAFPPRKLLASDCPAFIYTSTLIILTKDLVSRQSLLIYQTAKIYVIITIFTLCLLGFQLQIFLWTTWLTAYLGKWNPSKLSDAKCLVKLMETSKNRHLIENSPESLSLQIKLHWINTFSLCCSQQWS